MSNMPAPALVTEKVLYDSDTLITGDVTLGDWTTHLPQYDCTRAALGHGVYELNPDPTNDPAPQYGGVYARLPAPLVATKLVLTCEVKLPPGVASSTDVAAVIYRPATNGVTSVAVTPSDTWQEIRIELDAFPDEDHYQISVTVNHSGVQSGPQARCMIRNLRARYTDGLMGMPFRLFDISGEPLVCTLNTDHSLLGPRPSTQTRCIFRTNAPRIGIRWHSTLSQFPPQAPLVVRINGDTTITLVPQAYGRMLYSEVDLPDLGEDITVEIIDGPKANHALIFGDNPGAPSFDPVGTYVHALLIPEKSRVQFIRHRSTRRILVRCASIGNGWNASPVQTESWLARMRDAFEGTADVMARGWGWEPCYHIAKDAAAIEAEIQAIEASGFDPTDIVLHLETNDYAGPSSNGDGGGAWPAIAYQAGKTALVAALLTRFPNATIWCPSMEVRADEGVPNAHGNVPQDYRDATAAMVASFASTRVRYLNGLIIITAADLSDTCHPKPEAAPDMARAYYDWLR
jgi:hypothetical protein